MLGNLENLQRMRMKLVPNFNFDNHSEASAQRDNVKRLTAEVGDDTLLTTKIAVGAVNKDGITEEADLTEDDLKNIAKETMKNNEKQDIYQDAWTEAAQYCPQQWKITQRLV